MPTAPPTPLPARPAPAAGPGAAAVRAALRARVLARLPDLLVPPEAGPPETAPPETAPPETGPPEAGPPQAGPPQAGPPQAGPPQAGGLTAPLATGHRPKPGGLCAACRGPVRHGFTRCFHCDLHAESAPGLLADAVAPIAYAPKGGPLARDLWLYKSGRPGAAQAAAGLLALLLMYLHDPRGRAWQRAGLPAPTHVCVVPTGRGRPGPHPLQALAAPYLALPWAKLAQRPGADAWGRCLDPERFQLRQPLAAARVLLLDDTWVSGGAAQSAAVALKLGGCRSVVTVVLGRHVAAGDLPAVATPLAAPAGGPVGQ